MRYQILILLTVLLLFSAPLSTSAQGFRNQGEQDKYWTKEFFEKNYKRQFFQRFSGKILIADSATYIYNDEILKVHNTNRYLKQIFEKGILYNKIIGGDTLTISNLEEISFLSINPNIKRFEFLLFRKGLLNPTKCFIELTNTKANAKTEIADFINGASLTFFKVGWIMI